MASFNVELNSNSVRNTNEYTLLLRITVNRKHARIKLNYSIQVEKSDILTTLDRFRETMHFRLPKTTLS